MAGQGRGRHQLRAAAALAVLALAGCGSAAAQHRPRATPVPQGVHTTRVVTHRGAFRVTVDTLPQAWFRWSRGFEERTQTASEWSKNPAQQARVVPGVGGGAFWIRATRELVTSDGQRIVTVRVLHARGRGLPAAIAVARPRLGPVRIPEKTGP
jgi:hypothetical protein